MRELSDRDHALRRLGYARGYGAGYAASYRAAQAAMPPREPTQAMIDAGEKRRREIAGRGLCIGTIWRAMYDASTREQTSGGVDGHAASVGQQVAASHPGRGRPEAAPTAGIKPGPLDHQSAATPSASVGDDAQHGAAQAVTDGPAADPIDNLRARLYSLAKPHTYMLREEAAVVIERLRAERDCLKHELAEVRSVLQVTIAARNTYMAERDALRECVRAADAMADAYYPDPFHHAPPLTVDAYNAARAKVNTTEGEK